ncbi:MAG: T9SS type A sorting domain-containing protein, partial [Chitinophagaceae bacterium]|nr:T9SS type A sorting domain-containing protein [Chitinophagaceae bacterium]
YSIVDMDSNSGKGKVVEKNIILADHQHYVNCALTAVKHANGKDWWLVKADCINHRYQEFLVKEDTILGPFYQNITDTGDFCAFFSQIYFSQDGTQMASGIFGQIVNGTYSRNRVDIYDFDRCSGELIFKKYYMTPYDTITYPNKDRKSGICFSPNGKLLYMSNTYTIYQIDLEDTNTYNATFIHGPDTTINGFNWYNLMEIGPDSNIYIGYFGGSKSMSYINKPNEKGLACDYVIHGVTQPYTYLLDPPNMPNYGLGADSSKICWPLFISTSLKESTKLLCYPNPASTTLTIELITNKKGLVPIEMYNMVGELVLKTEIQTQTKVQINISSLPKGLYVIRCEGASQKVVLE